jgi:Domain of unknown function (DUF4265)
MAFSENIRKISINIPPFDNPDVAVENLWAEELGDSLFRVDNIPFFVFGISLNDVVLTESISGLKTVVKVVRRGGHSTYRVRMAKDKNIDDFVAVWQQFSSLSCTFEGTGEPDNIFSINVPPQTPVTEVYNMLEKHEEEGLWESEEAHFFDANVQA